MSTTAEVLKTKIKLPIRTDDIDDSATTGTDRLVNDVRVQVVAFLGVNSRFSIRLTQTSRSWYLAVCSSADGWNNWLRDFGIGHLANITTNDELEGLSRAIAIQQLMSFLPKSLVDAAGVGETEKKSDDFHHNNFGMASEFGDLGGCAAFGGMDGLGGFDGFAGSGGEEHDTTLHRRDPSSFLRYAKSEEMPMSFDLGYGGARPSLISFDGCGPDLVMIDNDFNKSNDSLLAISFRSFKNIHYIGNSCLGMNVNLRRVDVSETLPKLQTIGHCFCSNLQLDALDLRGLQGVEVVGGDFLLNTTFLNAPMNFSLSFPNLSKLTSGFMAACHNVSTIHLSHLRKLRVIGVGAFRSCESLSEIHLSGLTELEEIEDDVLCRCPLLTQVVLGDLPKLRSVGRRVASSSPLKDVQVGSVPVLEEFGSDSFPRFRKLFPIAGL